MLKSSADRLPTANIGDNILLPIAKPDIMTSIGSKNMTRAGELDFRVVLLKETTIEKWSG